MKKFKLSDIKSYMQMFQDDQYYKENTDKNQLVIHHTVSGDGVINDIRYWMSLKSRIGTAVIINRNGIINQVFSTRNWAHHIGVTDKIFKSLNLPNINKQLNINSIGIELDNWGGLKEKNGKYYAFPNNFSKVVVPTENVQLYDKPYRGYYAFEKYTYNQIETLMSFIVYCHKIYNIPLTYNDNIWDLNKDALIGLKQFV